MSAAEKLKALDKDADLRRCYVWVNEEERDITDQIVAVVEAAEGTVTVFRPEHKLCRALAALDEALQ